jgi:hypothetical protein
VPDTETGKSHARPERFATGDEGGGGDGDG